MYHEGELYSCVVFTQPVMAQVLDTEPHVLSSLIKVRPFPLLQVVSETVPTLRQASSNGGAHVVERLLGRKCDVVLTLVPPTHTHAIARSARTVDTHLLCGYGFDAVPQRDTSKGKDHAIEQFSYPF